MFAPRKTLPLTAWNDSDGLKLYTISASNAKVDIERFVPRLEEVKKRKNIPWQTTAAFAIFHEGVSMDYLVVAWWGNDNELFTSVSVTEEGTWIEDPSRFSFCLWDLEVIWHERNSFVRHMYSGKPSLVDYRSDTYRPNQSVDTTAVSAPG